MTQQSSSNSKKLNSKQVQQELKSLGIIMQATGEHGSNGAEYVIRFADDRDKDHGYYSEDLADILATGQAMAAYRKAHPVQAAGVEIYNPLPGNTPQFIATAAANIAPHSPISGELMREVMVGAYGQKPFAAWVSLKDRLVLPMKTE